MRKTAEYNCFKQSGIRAQRENNYLTSLTNLAFEELDLKYLLINPERTKYKLLTVIFMRSRNSFPKAQPKMWLERSGKRFHDMNACHCRKLNSVTCSHPVNLWNYVYNWYFQKFTMQKTANIQLTLSHSCTFPCQASSNSILTVQSPSLSL